MANIKNYIQHNESKKSLMYKEDDWLIVFKEGLTKGKEGIVVINDSETKDYKLEFDDGWQGYYNEGDVFVSEEECELYYTTKELGLF